MKTPNELFESGKISDLEYKILQEMWLTIGRLNRIKKSRSIVIKGNKKVQKTFYSKTFEKQANKMSQKIHKMLEKLK